MFKKLHFNISLAEALALMPKYNKMLKELISDKEKLLGLANTSLNENCLAVLLKMLPKKLGDPRRFLIPCDFHRVESCMALADLGASINLMPLSVRKKLSLHNLTPTRMTLKLATSLFVNQSVSPRNGDEKLILHADSTSKQKFQALENPTGRADYFVYRIDIVDFLCDKFPIENNSLSGNPTPSSDSVVESLSLLPTPFGDIDLLLEETDTFLSLDDSIPPGIDNGIYDSEGDIIFLEELLNDEILRDLPPKELKDDEPSTTKSLIEKLLEIDNEIYDSEGDILFLEKLLKDDHSEAVKSEIYTLKGEPPDTFLMEDEEIKLNPLKDSDDSVPIPRVFVTPLDSLDSILDSYDTSYTNPSELDSEYTLNYDNLNFNIQNEHSC
ncbi:reverse transcriptase domain-containing protein [Tanacetum coccineum]